MSSGTRTFGTALVDGGEYYFHRVWSGGDGMWVVSGTRYRDAWTSVRYRRTTRYDPILRRHVPLLVLLRTYHPRKVIGHTRKLDLAWHNYSLSQEQSSQTRVLPKNYPSPITSIGFPIALSSAGQIAAQSRLVNAVRGHDFNMAVSNAQAGLTLKMVSDTVVKSAKAIFLIKHGRFADAARTLGATSRRASGGPRIRTLTQHDVADAWLELQYGWKPLFKDVHDSAEALAYHCNPPRSTRLRVSVTENTSKTTDYTTSSVFHEGFARRVITCELREHLSTPRSLGLLDPLSVAWELLPFSFVADWFIPIGTYLDNLSIIPNIDGRFLVTDISHCRYLSSGKPGTGTAGGRASVEKLSVTRTVASALTTQTPSFKPLGLSMGHFENALALLTQLTR